MQSCNYLKKEIFSFRRGYPPSPAFFFAFFSLFTAHISFSVLYYRKVHENQGEV